PTSPARKRGAPDAAQRPHLRGGPPLPRVGEGHRPAQRRRVRLGHRHDRGPRRPPLPGHREGPPRVLHRGPHRRPRAARDGAARSGRPLGDRTRCRQRGQREGRDPAVGPGGGPDDRRLAGDPRAHWCGGEPRRRGDPADGHEARDRGDRLPEGSPRVRARVTAERVSRTVGPVGTNVHLLADARAREAIAIDTALRWVAWLTAELAERGWTLKLIVTTHGHWDHFGDNAAVAEQTGAPVAVHPLDAHRLTDPQPMWAPFPIPPSVPAVE